MQPSSVPKSLSLCFQFLISVRSPAHVMAPQEIPQPSWVHAVAEYLQRDLIYILQGKSWLTALKDYNHLV
jgi:hypothetical protein